MKIDQEIQQTVFYNEFLKAHINLLFTSSWMANRISEVLKPYKISRQQYNILRILKGQHPNPATVKLLTVRMVDKMSNASRLVDKLLKKELVKRKASKEDRRQVDIVITEKGIRLLEDANPKIHQAINIMFKNLSEKEAITLNELLDKLRR